MWIFIWFILSLFIMGVFGWSVVILRQQKAAWQAFAKKNGLDYLPGRFMESATVRGMYGGYKISLFSDLQKSADARNDRYVSIIEIEMGGGMPTGAAIGTAEMRNFIETLAFKDVIVPQHAQWKADYIAKTRDHDALQNYLTQARLDALINIFSMNRVSVLFFFDPEESVLHLETVDPLRNAEKLERIFNRIIAAVNKLAPDKADHTTTLPPDAEPAADPVQDNQFIG